MDLAIKKLVASFPSEGPKTITHVCMGSLKRTMMMTRANIDRFWREYQDLLDGQISLPSGIAEKPQKYAPVRGDIDIKMIEHSELQYGDRIHTRRHVMGVIAAHMEAIEEVVKNLKPEHLTCIYLDKPLYRVTKGDATYAKHGFHIHFPYLFLSTDEQKVYIIPRVKKIIKAMNLFEDIGIDDSSRMVDDGVTTVPWLLHGSTKDSGMDTYSVATVFTKNPGEDEKIRESSLYDALKHYMVYTSDERPIDLTAKGAIEYNLPRILSILPFNRETAEIRERLGTPLKEEMYAKKKLKKTYVVKTAMENLAIARKLLPMLSDERAENRNMWMTIGWILYNISEGIPEGLDLWDNFSQRCMEQYNATECIKKWSEMKMDDLTMGTLNYYASIDSPAEHMALKAEMATEYMHQSLNGSHNDIAKILFAEYGNEFVCANGKAWFQFVGHHWEAIEDGIFLRKKISGELVDRFESQARELMIEVARNGGSGGEGDLMNNRVKRMQKMIAQLRNSGFKSNVMKEACEVFYDKNFASKLNTNGRIFPCQNGTYDLDTDSFREGRPEDYCSVSSPIPYREFLETDPEVMMVQEFLSKIFPNKGIRDYFKDLVSDLFHGGNTQKVVYMWTGDGDNGKSVTQAIIEKMLGKLAIKFNTTLVTGKKVGAGAANPELARAGNGVRLGTIEEPNHDETINIGILKNLSGNDTFYARDLFEKGRDGREIQPMFKIFFICNALPDLKHSDKAIWGRMRVIPFESTFCRPEDPAPETEEEQRRQKRFPMDKEFASKIPKMLPAFMWMMLRHRRSVGEGLDRKTPKEVMVI